MKIERKQVTNIVFIVLLIFSSFMDFKGTSSIARPLHGLTLFVILIYLIARKAFSRRGLYAKRYVLLFLCLPWISLIPAYASHGQSFLQSALALYYIVGVFLLYFLFVELGVSERQLLKALTVFSLIYTFLELFQQITYPTYWFAGREESEFYGTLEKRQGMWKFYMSGVHFLVIPLFYYWEKLLEKSKFSRVISFIVLTIGLYAFLARKFMFGLVGSIVYSLVIKRKKVRWYYWMAIIVTGSVIYLNLNTFFADYVDRTQADLDAGDDWVRAQSTAFYLTYFDDPLCLVLGNGREYGESAYGKYIRSIGEPPLRFRRGDIGSYAHFSYYGIVGLIPPILFILFLYRRWKYVPLYIKLFFCYTLLQITVAFPLNSLIGSATLAIVIYLIEINMRDKLYREKQAALNDINSKQLELEPSNSVV